MIENQTIEIKEELKWSDLFNWQDLVSGKVNVPKSPGVYEVVSENCEECLHIGMAGDLNRRIIRQLTGNKKHSTRDRIAKENDLSKLKVRWAETKFPASVEEYLHRKYKTKYSKIKKYLT